VATQLVDRSGHLRTGLELHDAGTSTLEAHDNLAGNERLGCGGRRDYGGRQHEAEQGRANPCAWHPTPMIP
jgi:hypothetical protein